MRTRELKQISKSMRARDKDRNPICRLGWEIYDSLPREPEPIGGNRYQYDCTSLTQEERWKLIRVMRAMLAVGHVIDSGDYITIYYSADVLNRELS